MAVRQEIDWTRSRDIKLILGDQMPEWHHLAIAQTPFDGHVLQNVMSAVDGLRLKEENEERRERLFRIAQGLRENGIGKFMLDWGAKNAREGRPGFDQELVDVLKVIRVHTAKPVNPRLPNSAVADALITLYDSSYQETKKRLGNRFHPLPKSTPSSQPAQS